MSSSIEWQSMQQQIKEQLEFKIENDGK